MSFATVVLTGIAVVLFLFAFWKHGYQQAIGGLRFGAEMLWRFAPLLILAFVLSGLIEMLVPADAMRAWVGTEAGWRGPILGSVAGFLLPGGPYVILPIIATLYRTGAGLGTTVSLVTSWTLWNVISMAFEVSIVGVRFSLIRLSVGWIVPPLAGFLAQLFFAGGY